MILAQADSFLIKIKETILRMVSFVLWSFYN